jgi:hypothetical protein
MKTEAKIKINDVFVETETYNLFSNEKVVIQFLALKKKECGREINFDLALNYYNQLNDRFYLSLYECKIENREIKESKLINDGNYILKRVNMQSKYNQIPLITLIFKVA